MRPTRFHAARTREHDIDGDTARLYNPSRRRSSRAADTLAILCALGILAVVVFFPGVLQSQSRQHLYITATITLAFALAARFMRGVNTSGTAAGAVVAFVMAGRDLRMFWVLLIVFCVTLAATRAGDPRKRRLKLAEASGGRTASQVMSNLGVAALVLAFPSFAPACLMALAALAEAAADTTSSEIGTAFSGRIVMITTGKTVPPGTDGGLSVVGTLAGIVAAAAMAASAAALRLVDVRGAVAITAAGVLGMLVDSVLGATLERRGYLNNNLVNLFGTATAALAMWGMIRAFG